MNLKNSLENAKRKVKENLPIILVSAIAIGTTTAVAIKYRKMYFGLYEETRPRLKGITEYSLSMSDRAIDKIVAGAPLEAMKHVGRTEDVDLYIVTKDMLTGEAQESIPKVLFKD